MRTIASSLDEFSTSALVIAKYPKALQELEITSQVLGHLSKILASDDPAMTIAGIGMEELKRRLTRF